MPQSRSQSSNQQSAWRGPPEAATQALLVLYLAGVCARGYGFYNQTLKATPQLWMDVVRGTANAPEQYRVGVARAAFWMTQHTFPGLRLSQVFGVFDLVGSVAGVLALYAVLRGSATYRQASSALRWFGSACFAALTFYFVDWSGWYQKATTFPTVFFVAMMVWLWSPRGSERLPRWLNAVALLALVILQSFVRADIALVFCLGVLLGSALRRSELSLPRGAAMAVSAAGVVLAAGVQLYLVQVAYPNASYAGVPVFMLRHDWWRLPMWAGCLIFLAPVLWTMVQAARRRDARWQREPLEGAGAAMLLAGAGYAVLWIALGRLDEARIFLPMALAIVPTTVELAMRGVRESQP